MSELSSVRLSFTWSHGFSSCHFSERLNRSLMALVGGTAGLDSLENCFLDVYFLPFKVETDMPLLPFSLSGVTKKEPVIFATVNDQDF